jgi:hypothetical protein
VRGILGLGADLIDHAVDLRYGVEFNEEAGLGRDEFVLDGSVASAIGAPELRAEDVELLSVPGWLWYLDHLVGVRQLPSDEFLIALWFSGNHWLLRFRIVESVLLNEASAAILEVPVLDELSPFWSATVAVRPLEDGPIDEDRALTYDDGAVAELAIWLYQISTPSAAHLLRLLLGDPRTTSAARSQIDSHLDALQDEQIASAVRSDLGLEPPQR